MAGRERCVIYGSRSAYAAEVAEIVWRLGWEISVMVDNLPDGPIASPVAPVIRPSDLTAAQLRLPVIVPLLTPGFRLHIVAEARARGFTSFPTVVDPTAVVARSAALAEGTVVNAGVVIGAAASLGRFVHVNRSASIAHDVVVDELVSIGPGSVLSGFVRVRRGAFVGSGAVAVPRVVVGANATVGAGSVLVRDVPDGTVVAGNPARVIREGVPGYNGVGVPVPEI
jgi:sugar O-acyltransferase (sialic acid O-acetyltransferase NeuD family)